MSMVTTLILSAPILPEDVEDWLADNYGCTTLEDLTWGNWSDILWGGNKNPEVHLWGGAFNYFDLDGFLEKLAVVEWEFPDEVQVICQVHDEQRMRVYNLESRRVWSRVS